MSGRAAKIEFLRPAFLFTLVTFYVVHLSRHFWLLPGASDPLQYLGNVPWGNTYGYFFWLDRIAVAAHLALFGLLPIPVYHSGPIYMIVSNTLVMVLGMYWANRHSGFYSAFFFGLLYNISYFTLAYGVEIFPSSTLILYSMLAFICFSDESEKIDERWRFAAVGLFSVFATYSKITGGILPAYFVANLFYHRQWARLRFFSLGCVVGALAMPLMFVVFYDWVSFVNVVDRFFHGNIQSMLQGRERYNNFVSFYDVLVDKNFLPVFLSLFVSVAAYRRKSARQPLIFAWLYVIVIYAIYYISWRGYTPIPRYLYEAYIFAMLGVATYWGELYRRAQAEPLDRLDIVFLIGALFLSVQGLKIGILHSPSQIFEPTVLVNFPRWLGKFWGLGVLFIAVGVLWLEVKPSRWAVATLALFVSFWSSGYSGGLAYDHVNRIERPRIDFHYANAPLFNEVPVREYSVYIKSWFAVPQFDRILWVYRLFYDKRYKHGTGYTRQYDNERDIDGSIQILSSKEELKKAKFMSILTDDVKEVREVYPDAAVTNQMRWKDQILYVVSRATAAHAGIVDADMVNHRR